MCEVICVVNSRGRREPRLQYTRTGLELFICEGTGWYIGKLNSPSLSLDPPDPTNHNLKPLTHTSGLEQEVFLLVGDR